MSLHRIYRVSHGIFEGELMAYDEEPAHLAIVNRPKGVGECIFCTPEELHDLIQLASTLLLEAARTEPAVDTEVA